MSVIITIAFIAIVAMWATTVYGRLVRLRAQVTQAWKLLEVDQTKTAAQYVYNTRVTAYNNALAAFPAYLIAPLAGLQTARRFDSNPKSEI